METGVLIDVLFYIKQAGSNKKAVAFTTASLYNSIYFF